MAEKVPLKKGTAGIQERFQNYCMFLDVFDHLAAAMFVCDTGWQKMVAENLVSHKLCFSLWQQPGKKIIKKTARHWPDTWPVPPKKSNSRVEGAGGWTNYFVWLTTLLFVSVHKEILGNTRGYHKKWGHPPTI